MIALFVDEEDINSKDEDANCDEIYSNEISSGIYFSRDNNRKRNSLQYTLNLIIIPNYFL